jgi:hypothetical protein
MLKKTYLIFSVLIFCVSVSFGQTKTVVKDAKAKQMLLGNHKLSLQWIDFYKYFGVAKVTEKKGVLYLKGKQNQKDGEDFLTIDGKITKIEAKSFTFVGKIETSVSHINNGEVCTREGEMTFRITGKRKYWRLMQMDNPCSDVTDYVDIFFR